MSPQEKIDHIAQVVAEQSGCGSEAVASDADEPLYLIRKGAYFYRPNAQGYTSCKHEAGRYTLDEAIDHTHPNGPNGPRDGMDYMLAPECECDSDNTGCMLGTEAGQRRRLYRAIRDCLDEGEGPHSIALVAQEIVAADHLAVDQAKDAEIASLREELAAYAEDATNYSAGLSHELADARNEVACVTAERDALVEAVKNVLPVGNDKHPDNKVVAFYLTAGELRNLHALAASEGNSDGRD